MTANIAVLPTARVACINDVVRVLEEKLELARSGEIIAVGIAAVHADLATSTAYSRTDNASTLAGGAALLMTRLANQING